MEVTDEFRNTLYDLDIRAEQPKLGRVGGRLRRHVRVKLSYLIAKELSFW